VALDLAALVACAIPWASLKDRLKAYLWKNHTKPEGQIILFIERASPLVSAAAAEGGDGALPTMLNRPLARASCGAIARTTLNAYKKSSRKIPRWMPASNRHGEEAQAPLKIRLPFCG